MLPGRSPGYLISTCIYPPPTPLPTPSLLHLPSLHPLSAAGTRHDGTPAASAVPGQSPLPPGFNIHCSTSQRIAQFSILFSFFFSLDPF